MLPEDTLLRKTDIIANFGNISGIDKVLIPFNCLYDLDVGVIKLISEEYRSPDMFNLGFLDQTVKDKQRLVNTLYTRDNYNPLLLFMNDPYNVEVADDFYNQFISREDTYTKIIDECVYTGLYKMIQMNDAIKEVSFSIMYNNNIEYNELTNNDLFKNLELYSSEELLHKKKLDIFGSLFFKTPKASFLEIMKEKINNVTLYFLDYKYNFDEDDQLINKELLDYYAIDRDCDISIISAYDITKLKTENSDE